MNLHNPNPETTPGTHDPALDAAVRDALAADHSPAELEQRILALTDPSFNVLLDEALALDELPAGLTDRVLAATSPTGAPVSAQASPVLARIGFPVMRYAAAAAVVFAAGLGIYVASQSQQASGPDDSLADNTPANAADTEQSFDEYFASTDLDGSFAIDDKIDQLDSRISSVQDDFWGGDEDFDQQLWNELLGDG